MTRYHVDTPARLQLVKLAIDQAAGFRDALGNPIVRTLQVMQNGVIVGTIQSDVHEALRGLQPRTCHPVDGSSIVLGDDGTAALLLLETTHVEAQLGKSVSGVAIPLARDLVQIARARDNALLPTGVRDKLDDVYADKVYAESADKTAADAAITAELQSRAAAVIARKGTRDGQKALEAAMGLGRRE